MTSGFLEDASFNQSPAFGDVDLFSADRPLADAAARYGLDAEALVGLRQGLRLGRDARSRPRREREPAQAQDVDGKGNRIDFVEFHPAYHALMAKSIGWGIHSGAHDGSEPQSAPLTSRAVRLYLATQAESGHLCPITMTHACVGALKSEPDAADEVAGQDPVARLRPAAAAVVGKDRRHLRHGHDRAPGRHRRARQHHPGARRTAIMSRSAATNGSCRRRCATPSWCWRKRRAASPAI